MRITKSKKRKKAHNSCLPFMELLYAFPHINSTSFCNQVIRTLFYLKVLHHKIVIICKIKATGYSCIHLLNVSNLAKTDIYAFQTAFCDWGETAVINSECWVRNFTLSLQTCKIPENHIQIHCRFCTVMGFPYEFGKAAGKDILLATIFHNVYMLNITVN